MTLVAKKENVAHWQFDNDQLAWERTQYFRSLIVKLTKQLATLENQAPIAAELKRIAAESKVNWTTPELVYLIQNKMLLNVEEQLEHQLERVRVNLTSLVENTMPPKLRCSSGEDFIRVSPWLQHGLELILDSFRGDGKSHVLHLGSSLTPRIQDLVNEAIHQISHICAPAAEEIKYLIRECIMLSGEGLRSSTISQTFGAVYFLPREDWSLANVTDLLVHECAHHSLFIKTVITPLVTNPQELTSSPLREDKRPIIGVLHAVFVLIRVCHILQLWANHHLPDYETAEKLLIEYRPRLRSGLDILNKYAVWTESGLRLFESMVEGATTITEV